MSESYHLLALQVLTAAEKMAENYQIMDEHKELVKKALAGMKKDMEQAEKIARDVVRILERAAEGSEENIGTLTEAEIEALEED